MKQTDPTFTLPKVEEIASPAHLDTQKFESFLSALLHRMKDFPYACLSFPRFDLEESALASTLDIVIPAGDVGVWHAACLKEISERQIIHLVHHQGVTFRIELEENYVFQLHLVLEEKLPFPEADMLIAHAHMQDMVKVAPLRHVLTYLLHATHISNKQQVAFQRYFKSLPSEQKRKLTNELVRKYASI